MTYIGRRLWEDVQVGIYGSVMASALALFTGVVSHILSRTFGTPCFGWCLPRLQEQSLRVASIRLSFVAGSTGFQSSRPRR